MALPTYTVTLQFGSSSAVDVTAYVKSITFNKGINRVLEDYSAGTLSITFVNNSRVFDPLNTSSPLWYGAGGYTIVQPAGKVIVTANSIRRFTGYVQDWDFTFDSAGLNGEATLRALDQIYRVNNVVLTGGTNKVLESVTDRMSRLMSNGGLTAGSFSGGVTPVGADVNDPGDNLLNYMQQLARTEPGDLFSNASAVMVFKDRSFANYIWGNSNRQNYIKYPGTATVQVVGNDGWTTGYQQTAERAPLYTGGSANKSQIVTGNLDNEMSYQEIDIDKYNPNRNVNMTYVFSGWFKSQSGALTIQGDFSVFDANANIIGAVSNTLGINTSTWLQLSGTVTTAGTPAGIAYYVWTSGTTAAQNFYGNGLQVEQGTAWINYFDGSTNPYTNDASNKYEVGWLGRPYLSSSGMTIASASAIAAPTILTFADANSQGASYGNGTGLPFTNLAVAYGSDTLYNSVQVVGTNATATATDTVGQTRYGQKSYAQTDNLTTSLTRPAQIAAALLAEWRLPEYRAQAITVHLEALTTAQQNLVLAIELRDVVRVCFQPSATGSIIDKYYQVLAVDVNADPERDEVVFTLSSLDNLPIRLDSTLLAVLDTDTLG